MVVLVASLVVVVVPAPAAQAASPLGEATAIASGTDAPSAIAVGADGNLWFTDSLHAIGRITPNGVISTFTDPRIVGPRGITAGPDGNIWFTNTDSTSIGRITPGGVITLFSDPGIDFPSGITSGPDGNLWFTNEGADSIGRITPSGAVTFFTGAGISFPTRITTGPDGNLWFTNENSIGRITPAGVVSSYTGISNARGITSGPDGNIWFTLSGEIGRITLSGVVTIFPGQGLDAGSGIIAGPGGRLWFTNSGSSEIGRISTDGSLSAFDDPDLVSGGGIAVGPDGNVWFTDFGGDSIGRITPAGVPSTFRDSGVSHPFDLAAGADGNVWFTNLGNDTIGRVTPAGVVSTFAGDDIAAPLGIVSGPDGNLWFTNLGDDSIGRITPSGVVATFHGAGISGPFDITVGPDGNLWFTNADNDSIGRITPTGVVSNFTGAGISSPGGLTASADGNLWFTNADNDSIGRITPTGVVSIFTDAGINGPESIVSAADGGLWFTSVINGVIGRITPAGAVTTFSSFPANFGKPLVITAAPDGNLWFTTDLGHIGRITPAGVVSGYTPFGLTDQTNGITTGPDGNVWFADTRSSWIGSVGTGLPGAPTDVRASPSGSNSTVTWSPPVSSGDPPITAYTVTASPGGHTCSWSTGPLSCTVIGLSSGVSYTFTVTATNAIGTGPPSIGGALFHALVPSRVLDSRSGLTNVGSFASPWSPGVAGIRDVSIGGLGGVPIGADAVVLNVTVVNPSTGSFLQLWPTGATQPKFGSSLNFGAGHIRANAVTVKLGVGGKVSVFNAIGTVDVVIDVAGYYATGAGGEGFTPLPPARALDTRAGSTNIGPYTTPWTAGPGSIRDVPIGGVAGVPSGADAVVLNVTVVNPTASSYLQLWPKGASQPVFGSNVNFGIGQIVPNQVTVKLGVDGKVSVYNSVGTVDVIVDVAGYYLAGTGKPFYPVVPDRVLDSRSGPFNVGAFATPWGPGPAGIRNAQIGGRGGVPVDAAAVVMNVTVVSPTAGSFLQLWPTGTSQPVFGSSLNFGIGQIVPNAVTVRLGSGGRAGVFNAVGSVDVIADVAGYFR